MKADWKNYEKEPPKERGKYLVTRRNFLFPEGFIDNIFWARNLEEVDDYDFEGSNRPGWYDYDPEWGYSEVDGVIAWDYLPEPYKEES